MRLFVFLTDEVTYEVDDPQENYDDIEASPEFTKAEVYDSPQTTPENVAGLVRGDEDYLVPGQDGWAKTGYKTYSNKIQSGQSHQHPAPWQIWKNIFF